MHVSAREGFHRLIVALFCAVIGFGCADDTVIESTPTPAPPTATFTVVPTSTAPPPTATATASETPVPPSATPTVTETTRPTATDTPAPDTATPTATTASGDATALFQTDAQAADNPFPTDRMIDGETGLVQIAGERLSSVLPDDPRYDTARGYFDVVADQLSTLSGFSTFAPIRIRFDGPIDFAEGDNPPGILLIDLDDTNLIHPVRARAVTPDVSGDHALEIQPVVPLRPEHSYAYAVSRDILDADGDPILPDPDFQAALAGEVPELLSWRERLAPVVEALQSTYGWAIEDIAVLDVFTTQPTTADLIAIKDLLVGGDLPAPEPLFEGSGIPGLTTGVFAEGTPEFTELVGSPTSDVFSAVAVGTFPSFDFRFGAQSAFDPARVSGEVTPTTNELVFYLTIPDAPPPENGYPIVIAGHGLGGEGQNAISFAGAFGDEPVMVIGTSAVEHGRRGDVSNFFNLLDVFATREHFRQTIADFMQMTRMIRSSDVPPFDMVDRDNVRYFGVSLGGIMGTLFMGVEPEVRVGMLSVPGGGLPRIIRSEAIGGLLQPLISLITGVPQSDPLFPILLHHFIQTSQWALDPGDPINTAPFLIHDEPRLPGVPEKRILIHEGISDSVIPNATTEDLALAAGLPDVRARRGCTDPEGCSGIWRFVMTEYGAPADSGHGVTFLVQEALDQAVEFIASGGTVITDASPPEGQ